MPRMLADKKTTFTVLEDLPEDVNAATAEELNAGQNGSCLVGAAGFYLGAEAPSTTNDGALCEGQEVSVPTAAQHGGSMSVYRFFDKDSKQINIEEDWLFQAVKEFGSVIIAAIRDGKDHDEEYEDGDEYSLYEITVGGAGREADRAGYIKRPLHISVRALAEDRWVGGTPPAAPGP